MGTCWKRGFLNRIWDSGVTFGSSLYSRRENDCLCSCQFPTGCCLLSFSVGLEDLWRETINEESIWGCMWFSGDYAGVGLTVGLHDLECLFKPWWFFDSVLVYVFACKLCGMWHCASAHMKWALVSCTTCFTKVNLKEQGWIIMWLQTETTLSLKWKKTWLGFLNFYHSFGYFAPNTFQLSSE